MTDPGDGAPARRGSDAASAAPLPTEVDPRVAELVIAIRDRFGLRGLRGAQWMVEQEIALAEAALGDLAGD